MLLIWKPPAISPLRLDRAAFGEALIAKMVMGSPGLELTGAPAADFARFLADGALLLLAGCVGRIRVAVQAFPTFRCEPPAFMVGCAHHLRRLGFAARPPPYGRAGHLVAFRYLPISEIYIRTVCQFGHGITGARSLPTAEILLAPPGATCTEFHRAGKFHVRTSRLRAPHNCGA